jgi:hypothetical protein
MLAGMNFRRSIFGTPNWYSGCVSSPPVLDSSLMPTAPILTGGCSYSSNHARPMLESLSPPAEVGNYSLCKRAIGPAVSELPQMRGGFV